MATQTAHTDCQIGYSHDPMSNSDAVGFWFSRSGDLIYHASKGARVPDDCPLTPEQALTLSEWLETAALAVDPGLSASRVKAAQDKASPSPGR